MMSKQKQFGFALEYSLGHVTHAQNLKAAIATRGDVAPVYVELDYNDRSHSWQRLPGIRSNWSLRASLGAYRGLSTVAGQLKAALFHTQVTSLLSPRLMQRVPSLISLDATPEQYDALGSHYGHTVGQGPMERVKKYLNCRAFAAACHIIAWSEWTKSSLVQDYGVAADKITVIPPGIDTGAWNFEAARSKRGSQAETTFLFVGADFTRKGGDTLLEAFVRLPAHVPARLSLVTRSDVSSAVEAARRQTGRTIDVWNGLAPNSPELKQRFAEADVFVFPSRADCLPLAVMEALATGLPVITTTVGALSEAVQDKTTGLIVPPNDSAALAVALESLVEKGNRDTMGQAAREFATDRFNAATNYNRLLATMEKYAI